MNNQDSVSAPRPYVRPSGESERIWMLSIKDIEPDPFQARKIFEPDRLRELSESIREFGVMSPLLVRKTHGGFQLIAGERRLRAAAMAGLSHVPCIISSADGEKAAYMSLVENLQRRDLDCFEEAAGISRLILTYGLTQEEAAAKIGKSQSAVANKLRLLRLDGDCIAKIRSSGLTERHARALLRLGDRNSVLSAIDVIHKNKMSVSETERYVDSLLAPSAPAETPAAKERKIILHDARVLVNSIKAAVATANSGGISARMERRDTEDSITITVILPKR
ncbi:MAG: ParB/RepB/Spo0J family partition protein [Eubacteriales bacterium]